MRECGNGHCVNAGRPSPSAAPAAPAMCEGSVCAHLKMPARGARAPRGVEGSSWSLCGLRGARARAGGEWDKRGKCGAVWRSGAGGRGAPALTTCTARAPTSSTAQQGSSFVCRSALLGRPPAVSLSPTLPPDTTHAPLLAPTSALAAVQPHGTGRLHARPAPDVRRCWLCTLHNRRSCTRPTLHVSVTCHSVGCLRLLPGLRCSQLHGRSAGTGVRSCKEASTLHTR